MQKSSTPRQALRVFWGFCLEAPCLVLSMMKRQINSEYCDVLCKRRMYTYLPAIIYIHRAIPHRSVFWLLKCDDILNRERERRDTSPVRERIFLFSRHSPIWFYSFSFMTYLLCRIHNKPKREKKKDKKSLSKSSRALYIEESKKERKQALWTRRREEKDFASATRRRKPTRNNKRVRDQHRNPPPLLKVLFSRLCTDRPFARTKSEKEKKKTMIKHIHSRRQQNPPPPLIKPSYPTPVFHPFSLSIKIK